MIGRSMTALPPVYHPAVFFCHLHLTGLLDQQRKIVRPFFLNVAI
jgi:hypothetical protein